VDPRTKKFQLLPSQIRQLVPSMGACYASDRITVDGCRVGYMYREKPDSATDSGWRFFAGDESEDYANTADNLAIYEVNTVCNYDQAIIPYLTATYGSAFGRNAETNGFEPEAAPTDDSAGCDS